MSRASSEAPSDASGSYASTSRMQDDTARKILELLRGKDVEIRKLENENKALKDRCEEQSHELEDVSRRLNSSEVSRQGTHSVVERAKNEMDFAVSEYKAISMDKNILLKQLRQEMDKSRDLEIERDTHIAQAQDKESHVAALTAEIAYQKQLIENMTQRLQLHEEDAKDLEDEHRKQEEALKKLRDELRNKGKENDIHLQSLKTNLADESAAVQSLKADNAQLKKSLSEANRESASLRAELQLKTDEITELQQEISELELANRQNAEEQGSRIQELTEKTRHVDLFNLEIRSFQRKLEEVSASLKLAEDEKDKLAEEAEGLRTEADNIEQEKASIARQLADTEGSLKELRVSYAAMQRAQQDLKGKMRVQAAALAEANNTLGVTRAEQEHLLNEAMKVAQLEDHIHELERELEMEKNNCEMAEAAAQLHQNNVIEVHQEYLAFQNKTTEEVSKLEAKLTETECRLTVKTDLVEATKVKLTQSEDRAKELEEAVIVLEQRLSDVQAELTEARGNYLKSQKIVKKLKSENTKEVATRHELQTEYKELSTKGVGEMRKQQELISLLTLGRDEALQRCEEAEKKLALMHVKLEHCESRIKAIRKEHGTEVTRLETVLKTMQKDAETKAAAIDRLQREKEDIFTEYNEMKKIIAQLQEEAKEAVEGRVQHAKSIANLKRQIAHHENVKKSLEGKLEAQTKQEKSRLKQIESSNRLGREDERKRHEMIVELRKEKARLSEQVIELTEDVQKGEEKIKVLQAAANRNLRTISELRERVGGGGGKSLKDDPAPNLEWQDFIMAQLLTFTKFLIHSNLEVISKILSLKKSKQDCLSLLSPLSLFDESDARSLLDDSLLTLDHYTNVLRTCTGYTKGSIASPPKLKISGGLREGKRPQDLAGVFTSLVTRRIKLEARLADITAI
eukprot:TRINITY_DN2721_c0_g1_i1.p1 TRINITY_DN2721_c0_g1~~TRINITY_DN2721_c0_g1_i1.p1  ORF type:complete len:915 (+),score=260.67 TRINITY_DN2721_c0_g1_i1:3362-6106(+)